MSEKKQQGRILRVSPEVDIMLRRKQKRGESFDSLLRRLFGLPTKKGKPQELATYYVIPNEGHPLIFTDEAEALGGAVRLAVKLGKKKTEAVITVKEVA